jgi:hypothetical protein
MSTNNNYNNSSQKENIDNNSSAGKSHTPNEVRIFSAIIRPIFYWSGLEQSRDKIFAKTFFSLRFAISDESAPILHPSLRGYFNFAIPWKRGRNHPQQQQQLLQLEPLEQKMYDGDDIYSYLPEEIEEEIIVSPSGSPHSRRRKIVSGNIDLSSKEEKEPHGQRISTRRSDDSRAASTSFSSPGNTVSDANPKYIKIASEEKLLERRRLESANSNLISSSSPFNRQLRTREMLNEKEFSKEKKPGVFNAIEYKNPLLSDNNIGVQKNNVDSSITIPSQSQSKNSESKLREKSPNTRTTVDDKSKITHFSYVIKTKRGSSNPSDGHNYGSLNGKAPKMRMSESHIMGNRKDVSVANGSLTSKNPESSNSVQQPKPMESKMTDDNLPVQEQQRQFLNTSAAAAPQIEKSGRITATKSARSIEHISAISSSSSMQQDHDGDEGSDGNLINSNKSLNSNTDDLKSSNSVQQPKPMESTLMSDSVSRQKREHPSPHYRLHSESITSPAQTRSGLEQKMNTSNINNKPSTVNVNKLEIHMVGNKTTTPRYMANPSIEIAESRNGDNNSNSSSSINYTNQSIESLNESYLWKYKVRF